MGVPSHQSSKHAGSIETSFVVELVSCGHRKEKNINILTLSVVPVDIMDFSWIFSRLRA